MHCIMVTWAKHSLQSWTSQLKAVEARTKKILHIMQEEQDALVTTRADLLPKAVPALAYRRKHIVLIQIRVITKSAVFWYLNNQLGR